MITMTPMICSAWTAKAQPATARRRPRMTTRVLRGGGDDPGAAGGGGQRGEGFGLRGVGEGGAVGFDQLVAAQRPTTPIAVAADGTQLLIRCRTGSRTSIRGSTLSTRRPASHSGPPP